MFFSYIKESITRNGCIVKITNGDFIYYPDPKQHAIGWKTRSHVKSKNMTGVMEFKCKLFLPKEFEKLTIGVDDENFMNALENLEFIKTTEEVEINKGTGL